MAIDWFAHVPKSKIPDFLNGLHRHLRQQGLVIFCDQLPGSDSWTGRFDSEGNHLQCRTLNDAASYTVIKHFSSDQEMQAIFADFATHIEIKRFPSVRRVIMHFDRTSGVPLLYP